MTDDRRNIKLPADVFERHNEKRKELGLTWEEYISGNVEDYRGVDQEAVELLRRLHDGQATIEERVGRIEALLEDLGGGR